MCGLCWKTSSSESFKGWVVSAVGSGGRKLFSSSMSSKMGNCGRSLSSSTERHGDWWKSSPSEYVFLRRFPSVTTHSTSSSRQFVHGMPLSTTSLRTPLVTAKIEVVPSGSRSKKSFNTCTTYQRTFLPRQQWQAFEARRFTARPPVDKPAAEDFLFGWTLDVVIDTGILY
jgi:hypothetical protein